MKAFIIVSNITVVIAVVMLFLSMVLIGSTNVPDHHETILIGIVLAIVTIFLSHLDKSNVRKVIWAAVPALIALYYIVSHLKQWK